VRADIPVTEIALGAVERTAPEVGDVPAKLFANAEIGAMRRPIARIAARPAEMDGFFTFTPYSPD
jgi:hypothetical protein